MPEVDAASAVAGGTENDQKRLGTHKEHFSRLSDQFKELMEHGAATPERFKQLCFTLLKSFEGVRLDQEGQIKKYEANIAYCRATQQACSMFSNLLVGALATQVQEVKRAEAVGSAPLPAQIPGNGDRVSDKEMLQRICICGCVDEEDAANCDCSCHQGEPCKDERCVVCQAKLALETSGRRQPPKPKAPAKKTTRKKAPRKKAAKKKGE